MDEIIFIFYFSLLKVLMEKNVQQTLVTCATQMQTWCMERAILGGWIHQCSTFVQRENIWSIA